MRTPYSFSILRYVHDPVTQEFVNVGVAVYSADAKFLDIRCTSHYSRITRLFTKIDGNRFRQLIRYVEDEIRTIGERLPSELPFEPGQAIERLLARVLPPDDSSFQFSSAGVGLARDLGKVTGELFERYVERYSSGGEFLRREDDEIWRIFRDPLVRRQVSAYMEPKRIVAPDYQYDFEHAWKNRVWHVYEPVSFDLMDAGSMLDKANRWLGRATSLRDSPEPFNIHLLLGEPQDRRLRDTYAKAQNILRRIPGPCDLIPEGEAEAFAEEFQREVEHHAESRVDR